MAEGYRYCFVDINSFKPEFPERRKALFAEGNTIILEDFYSADERARLDGLKQHYHKGIELCLLAYDGERLIGWLIGNQDGPDSFYMRNAAVYPEYRRRGVYGAMLRQVMDKAVSLGFQRIWSRHLASNNAVIIPKLKAGFVFSAMEISEKYGIMVQLSFFPNPRRHEAMRYRTGEVKHVGECCE